MYNSQIYKQNAETNLFFFVVVLQVNYYYLISYILKGVNGMRIIIGIIFWSLRWRSVFNRPFTRRLFINTNYLIQTNDNIVKFIFNQLYSIHGDGGLTGGGVVISCQKNANGIVTAMACGANTNVEKTNSSRSNSSAG